MDKRFSGLEPYDGRPAVCISDDPHSLDVNRIYEDSSLMGITKGFIDSFLDPVRNCGKK